jgi:tetratricopeptide (TPR) repeat protein
LPRPRWQFILGLIVAIILALAAGAFAQWLQHKDVAKNKGTSKITPPPDSVADARDLLTKGKINETDASLDQSLAKPGLSNNERFALYMEKGRVAQIREDYAAAIDSFMKAEAIKQTSEVERKLGVSWEALGDKQKALDYYKKALQLNAKSSPTYDADKRMLEMMIQSIEEPS